MKILVTGFGPFGSVSMNPSGELAQECGRPFRLLPVTFREVEAFLQEVKKNSPQALLMMGVAARSRVMRLEQLGRNWVGPTPDVEGIVRGPGPISESGPAGIESTLWYRGVRVRPGSRYSNDAGDYLCNFALYRALELEVAPRVGFLHVPLFEQMPKEKQAKVLEKILARVEERLPSAELSQKIESSAS